jgi:hypothetical protein
METTFIQNKINYNGSQLRSRWISDTTGLTGNAVTAFVGGCDIHPEYMVDLVDKANGCKIYSEEMLHFIAEFFDSDLDKMILHQRLFIAIIQSIILSLSKDDNLRLTRKGNDLYDGDAKINISIATSSPVSSLMHIGVNISSKNTPVKTKGLMDYDINPERFAAEVMKMYSEEVEGIKIARTKVKPVS